jgi:ribonucleoside-diphosphate reductase alpha chain
MITTLPIPTTTFEDDFSEEVWSTTYKDHSDGDVNHMMKRVAGAAASVEETPALRIQWATLFYDMLSEFKATTGGRIYSNAGTEWNGTTLMNCFVSPRDNYDIDSLDAILKDVRNQCQTLKSEGGWGQNFSYIRPRGSFIGGIGVESPGAVKYMEIFDKTSDVITSGSGKKSENKKAKGKIRKGAMMGVMDVWHPDVIEFITAKQQPGRLTKFNISVNCTDEFMDKVTRVVEIEKQIHEELTFDQPDQAKIGCLEIEKASVDEWNLRFPVTTCEQYKSEWRGDIKVWESKQYPMTTHRVVSASWLWNLIMESTYNRAEPGVLFLDRANYYGPLNYLETIFATNPCGEQTLAPGGVCNLGSINLTQFINADRTGFDLEKIRKYTRYLNRFLDNINSLSNAPLPEYMDSMKNKRRVGIGILGWGSALFMLKVRFGSEKAAELRDDVMRTIAREAYMSSIDLAEEKGMFKYCIPEKHAEGAFVNNLELSTEYMHKLRTTGIRNSSLLSIQPTGNTSILANVVSGGLEPIFMPEYVRTVIVGTMPDDIKDVCPVWYEGAWHETDMFKFTKEGDEEILKGVSPNGTVYKIDKNRGLTKEVLCQDYGVRWLSNRGEWDPTADWAVTTLNLSVEDHVEDLKGFAHWVDSAMSKTINIPNEYPFPDFKNIYLDTYNSGVVKGVTTYRSGTMTTVLSAKETVSNGRVEEIIVDDVKVPSQAPAMVSTIRADGKKWYLTTILDTTGQRPIAFFVHTNHYEKTVTTHDAVERLIKLARDKGIPEKWIEDTQKKIDVDNNPTKIARAISLNLRHGVLIKNVVAVLDHVEDIYVGSFLFQIRKFLSVYIKDGEQVEGEKCESCGSTNIVFSEGCRKCLSCGSGKCS